MLLRAARVLRAPKPLPLSGRDGEGGIEPEVSLPAMTPGQEVIENYHSLRLFLRAHPLELLRPRLPESLPHDRPGTGNGRITVTGPVIARQRPGTASGVVFLTLEDETGVANVVVWRKVYERFRKSVISGRLLRVAGRVEREGQVVHMIAEQIGDLSPMLLTLGNPSLPGSNDNQPDAARHPANTGNRPGDRHSGEQLNVLRLKSEGSVGLERLRRTFECFSD